MIVRLGASDNQDVGTRVKICGLTRPVDAEFAARQGADALGVVFASGPRRLDIVRAAEVLAAAPVRVQRVGVFADQALEFIQEATERCRLDWIQLHGHERAELAAALTAKVIKAVRVAGAADLERARDYPADAFLLDAPAADGRLGGTGEVFDWSEAEHLPWPRSKVIVAGGLNPGNVGAAVERLRPGGVDVSSGVESAPGVKDHALTAAFVAAVRETDARIGS
ncbi:MAG: N-(5'-phosphoribosyl)anthranilate isomerase [Gemmatimonadetes bacterium]|nr:N-(5'-phosphoribosyl)anthranilate isomerase [Gemmatimonadota bacterium]NIO31477.1 N-(5'-phosphoribosyl)anthranilate isomerase [Gemmatimonadota bacterium]